MSSVKDSIFTTVFSGAVGLLFSFQSFISNKDKLVAPFLSSLIGYQNYGFKGVVVGSVIGVFDETLVTFNVTTNHYLTQCMIGVSLTNSFLPKTDTLLTSVISQWSSFSYAFAKLKNYPKI